MSKKELTMDYDTRKREATFSFRNGHKLVVGNISAAQAKVWHEKHAPEFERCDCRFTSNGALFTRESLELMKSAGTEGPEV